MLTLAEYNIGKRDHLDTLVIDEFRRDSFLLDKLFFDDAVAATGSGSTLAYNYVKLLTPSGAATRKLNDEYVANEASREEEGTHLVIMGGSFKLDRVVAKTSGAIDEVQFQLRDKIKATSNFFHYMALNGVEAKDSATGSYTAFNGLSTLLEGASTEVTSKSVLTAMSEDVAFSFLDEIEESISNMAVKPDAFMMNSKLRLKFISAARRAGYLTQSEDAFGRPVETYNGIALIDAGEYYDKAMAKTVSAVPVTEGKTDLFAVSFDRDGFIGVSAVAGQNLITSRVPDFTRAEAVQEGYVEMLASVALKNTKKAAVLRGITVGA